MNCSGTQAALVVREGGNNGDGDDACNGNMAVAAAVSFVCSLVLFTATNCNVIATHNTDNFAIIFRKLSDNLLLIMQKLLVIIDNLSLGLNNLR